MRRDPYAVWVAEIMLQQTQVATVVPYFEKWMKTFPDVAALARASESEVMRAWAGLGYYSRARNLHRAAGLIAEQGSYPATALAWQALPGIGPYTAGAIASLAFDAPAPILDGNVVRVFSRVFALNFLPENGREQREAYWKLSGIWAAGKHPGNANEGLMELGAVVCKPAVPLCGACPLQSACVARKRNWQETLPPVKQRQKVEIVTGAAIVLKNRNRVLLETRPQNSFLAGHQLFPMFLDKKVRDWRKAFAKRFPECVKEQVGSGTVKHSIMSKRYVLEVFLTTFIGRSSLKNTGTESPKSTWVSQDRVDEILTNSLARKIWKAVKD